MSASSNESPGVDRSWLARIGETPMRDLARGQVTGRLDIDAMLTASALPEDVAALIKRVTRRTRLWRLERVDVARELIAHFRDALAAHTPTAAVMGAGAAALTTPGALISDFGDERQAARLIRRAKRRQRPLVWHAWRRSLQALGGVFLLLVVAYAWLAFRYWTGEPKITHDYLADVNAKALAVPESERAWPVYREALLALPSGFEWSKSHNLGAHPGDWDWSPVAQAVRENQPAIERLRGAALMPGLGFKIGPGHGDPADAALMPEAVESPVAEAQSAAEAPWQRTLFMTLLPQVGKLKSAAMWLGADARAAALEGDAARALLDIRAILGVARHARENPFLINEMVFLSIVNLGIGVATDTLANAPNLWSDDQLRELAHSIASLRDDEFHARFDGERASFADLVQRIYTDDGNGNGRAARDWASAVAALTTNPTDIFPAGERVVTFALAPVGMAVMADRRDLMNEYERLMGYVQARAARPMWERALPAEEVAREQRSIVDRARFALLDVFFLGVENVIPQFDHVGMRRDAALVAVALERFKRSTARYPDSLADLAPDLLPAAPLDCYDGKPVKYRVIDGKPLLYSVGNDRIDNGGRLHLTTDGKPDNEKPMRWMPPGGRPAGADGWPWRADPAVGSDWILYPPVRTPVKAPEEEAEASPPSVPAQPARD